MSLKLNLEKLFFLSPFKLQKYCTYCPHQSNNPEYKNSNALK